jgi:tetratricopeptide (TPR) repeat protein
MKRIILILVLAFSFLNAFSQSFADDFRKAVAKKDLKRAEEVLHAWEFSDANDPDVYIGYFNLFTLKSLEKDSTKYDKELAHKALEYISYGITNYPTRFDMRVAKIYMYGRLKEFKPFTDNVIQLIEYSKKINCNWKGEGFRILDTPEKIFSGAVLDAQETLFAQKDSTLYKDIIRISEVMHANFPKDYQCLLSLSMVYFTQKKYDKSLEVLLKAKDLEPNNAVLMYNLAQVYREKGDKDNLRRYLELTVRMATQKEEKLSQAAKKQLNELK